MTEEVQIAVAEKEVCDETVEKAKPATADPWDVTMPESNEKSWSERSGIEKAIFVGLQIGKVICVLGCLYLFIVSLGLMGTAFTILGGPSAGEVFRNQHIFDNPIAGLVLGILATVLVQSSSTSTSIIITMTAANLMKVQNAIPMIMGSNIGTSVTNTIVSIGQIGNRDEYRRAFAGATVHDCFNLLTVAILLPVECITGMLRHISEAAVESAGITNDSEKASKYDFLKKITKPVTSRLVQYDKAIVTSVASETDPAKLEKLLKTSMIVNKQDKDNHLFMDTPMDDTAAGVLLLVVSLVLLTTCLILLVKTLQSVFRGKAAIWMKFLLNLEFKSVPMVGDYILVLFGAAITILMQSSSITTSTLTPLVGIGLVRLEKMFPFTVGANIGTCCTGILSALASGNMAVGMTVALSHLFFNVIGTAIWFPIPMMRRVPISMAKLLGNLAADCPWFPFAYIFSVFGLIPGALFLFSLAGDAVVAVFGTLLLGSIAAVVAVIALRLNRPQLLPALLRSDPRWMPRSLRVCPLDDEAQTTEAETSGSADLNKGNWKLTWAWGTGWLVILLLVTSLPNAQWANLKYSKFDGRDHIGIGAWSACSVLYEKEIKFMAAPTTCSAMQLSSCLSGLASKCSASGFADAAGANAVYEKSWAACKTNCSTAEWVSQCGATSCSGSLHAKQCQNISSVLRPYTVSYGAAGQVAWPKGEKCVPLDKICSNLGGLPHAGNLGILALICAVIGQVLLLTYAFLDGKRDLKHALAGSLGSFACCWVFLLSSWALVAGALNETTKCLVMDETSRGAVYAEGPLRDIANGGSYTFAFAIASWLMTTLVVAIVGLEIYIRITTSGKMPEASI